MKKSKPFTQLTKPKSANPSKRTSCVSSAVYKQVNQKIRQLIQHSLLPYNNKKKQVKPFYKQVKKEQSSMRSALVRVKSPLQKYSNINSQNSHFEDKMKSKVDKNSFKYKYIVGKGGFGKVWKVEHRKTRKVWAMKEMLKAIVMTKKSVQSILNERILLAGLFSSFLVNMKYAFQDRQTFYLVLDLMEGGDLRYHLSYKKFSEVQSKFFIACIILGLQYLHKNCILHRDIKPENLVFDERGYLRITDLGIARTYKLNNSADTSGTPGYMSPEVICRQNHSYPSDYFAVGVIAYELAMGKRPYNGNSRQQIRQAMLSKQVQIRKSEKSEEWSQEGMSFINKMIQRKQQNRLGYNGIEEIKNHEWLRDVDWKKLKQKELQPPFNPNMKKCDFDQDPQITVQNEEEAQMIKNNALLLKKPELQDSFKNYDYNGDIRHEQRKTSENGMKSKEKVLSKKMQKSFINDFIYRKAYTIDVGRKKKESKEKNILYKQFNF